MELKNITYRYNPLLERKEVYLDVDHSSEGSTPSRMAIRDALAKHFGVDPACVVVRKVETRTGAMMAKVEAHVYDRPDIALSVEPEHVLRKNKLLPEGGEKSAP